MEPQSTPLVCKSHTSQYVTAFVVGLLVGVVSLFVYLKLAPVSIGGGTYQDGFEAAKARVLENPMGRMFNAPDDIRTLSGTVTAIGGNQITLNTISTNPFDDPAFADRTVLVSTDTKITKISQGDQKAFQAEMEAFMKKMQSGAGVTGLPPRLPESTLTTVEVSSIKVGDILTATAIENIKEVEKFTASEIQIQ